MKRSMVSQTRALILQASKLNFSSMRVQKAFFQASFDASEFFQENKKSFTETDSTITSKLVENIPGLKTISKSNCMFFTLPSAVNHSTSFNFFFIPITLTPPFRRCSPKHHIKSRAKSSVISVLLRSNTLIGWIFFFFVFLENTKGKYRNRFSISGLRNFALSMKKHVETSIYVFVCFQVRTIWVNPKKVSV